MKILIALILLGLTVSLSTRVLADEHSKLRVVVVETDDACSGQVQPDTFLKEFSNSIGD